ncbi:MAG: chloride channel protein [Planctomycetota bacterium]|nr:MAG: chloride channel protein [Planctomycetota bacterium]
MVKLKIHSQHYERMLRLVFLPAIVGVIAGLGGVCFAYALEAVQHYALAGVAGYIEEGAGGEHSPFGVPDAKELVPWLLLLLPTVGGLLSGYLIFRWCPECAGHGTDNAIDAYHNKGGQVRKRVPYLKALTAAITIGTGGSAGREGPIAQIGSGLGSTLAKWLGLSPQYRRVLLIAGMGAGVGSIFHAPMAGALFASEVLYREMELEAEVLVPATVASIVGYSVFTTIMGSSSLFVTSAAISFDAAYELMPYTLLALVLAVGAFVYARFFYLVEGFFERMPGPPHLRPAVGGLLVGIMGFLGCQEAMAGGYGIVQKAIDGAATWHFLLLMAGLKILSTCFTIGSGGSGGLFGPSIVIGGALGGAVGLGLEQVIPELMPSSPAAFAIVGMAGFFAAAAKTPFSTVIMVSEMTGSYELLVPTLWVCVISFVLLRHTTIYARQPGNRLDSPAHLGEMLSGTLERIRVREAMGSIRQELVTLPRSMPLKKIMSLFAEHPQEAFPVVGRDGGFLGAIDNRALRACAGQTEYLDFLVAEDLAQQVPFVTPEDDLLRATQLMAESQTDEILIVSDEDSRQIVGFLHQSQITASYARYSSVLG